MADLSTPSNSFWREPKAAERVWLIYQLHQTLSAAFGSRQSELRFQLVVVSRRLGNRSLFCFAEWLDAIVPAGNGDVSRVVLHRCEQPRENHRRIRRPVAVVPAMQRALRSVNRHVNILIAAHARSEERRVGKECRSRWS